MLLRLLFVGTCLIVILVCASPAGSQDASPGPSRPESSLGVLNQSTRRLFWTESVGRFSEINVSSKRSDRRFYHPVSLPPPLKRTNDRWKHLCNLHPRLSPVVPDRGEDKSLNHRVTLGHETEKLTRDRVTKSYRTLHVSSFSLLVSKEKTSTPSRTLTPTNPTTTFPV